MTHLQILWTEPVWDRLDVTMSVGPSFINVAQAVLSGIAVSEVAAPYTTIRVDELTTAEQVVNTVGVHIGADATYMVTPKVGAGFYVRFVSGSADVTTLGGVVSVDVGGVQTGGGSGSDSETGLTDDRSYQRPSTRRPAPIRPTAPPRGHPATAYPVGTRTPTHTARGEGRPAEAGR